ncbi:hypothetical protein ABEV36_00930 [Heyndrickxia faecalis]|uniref:hypothetical protein n=1 Tax=Heyndrickxia faecalis TaxID=2824910 RepID=UPI0035963E3E
MIFEGFKKRPKRESESERIVLLEASKRQNRPGPGANCLFGEFKKTKESCNPVELSFWGLQKDKRKPDPGQFVLLEVSKRQKRPGPGANCLFGEFKKTKESCNPSELSFWRVQKDKRELESGRIVFLGASKRQKKAVIRANCPFGGFKKTKGSWNPVELSFWRVQKDKRELESGRIVLLEGSKRQKRPGPGANCPFKGSNKEIRACKLRVYC